MAANNPVTLAAAADKALFGDGSQEVASQVAVQVTGTFVGTITWEAQIDGSTFASMQGVPLATGTAATTTTVPGLFRLETTGLKQVRAHMTAFTSGSAVVTFQPVIG